MDPNDLLYLHATLAATIRQQQARIDQQQVQINQLQVQIAELAVPTEGTE